MMAFAVLILVGYFSACYGYSWIGGDNSNGSYFYACVGDSITFPWSIITSSSERVIEMKWYFSSNDENSEHIATYDSREFCVPHSTRQHLFFAENVGLTISNLTQEDLGKYSVRVDINSDSSNVTEARYAYVHSPVPPATEGDLLHARIVQRAVHSSGEWHVQLACGKFYSSGSSSFSVKWKTPSGRVLNYDTGAIYDRILTLSYPIEEGNYSCYIDIHDPAGRCAYVPPTMLVSNEIHVDNCSAQRALHNAAKQEIEDISSALQQLVIKGPDNVRLVNGSRPWNGRVEVKYYNGTWGTVCSSYYQHDLAAAVVCRMVGFSQYSSYTPQACLGSYCYGKSTLPILLTHVSCKGNEANIFNCSYSSTYQSCYELELGVDCWPGFTTN